MLCVGKNVDEGEFTLTGRKREKRKGKIKENGDDRLSLDFRVRVNSLYDFYAPLLTQRQRDIYEMRCFLDLSLAEIAEALGVTRQAVHILVNRIEERLLILEETLGFATQVERLESRIEELEAREIKIK
ncbi:MAG: hypothetical protein LBJ36_03585 [Synergistaceae bacterium]|nr:hypothetical protein [Synergistaceae bacterium]